MGRCYVGSVEQDVADISIELFRFEADPKHTKKGTRGFLVTALAGPGGVTLAPFVYQIITVRHREPFEFHFCHRAAKSRSSLCPLVRQGVAPGLQSLDQRQFR